MAQYQWLQFGDAKTALSQRLADTAKIFWTDAEIGLYIIEALRTYNALTSFWNAEFQFQAPINANQIWYRLDQIANSPRARTVTDNDLYVLMRYHLLESPTGSLTSQFTQADLTGALQRRRDEILQTTNCNLAQITAASTPNLWRTFLPDTTLEVVRARFVPTPIFGDPFVLYRDDRLAFQFFEPDFQQATQSTEDMLAYDVLSVPPLALNVNAPPNMPGSYDLLVNQSGAAFNPPTLTPVGVPNDFAWVAKWGALADLLGRESEATDRARADFCLQRYLDGLKLMLSAPWMLLASLNGIPVDTPSVAEMDEFQPGWDSDTSAPDSVVTAGIDFFAVSPVPTTPQTGVFLTVTGNAPVPVLDADYVQVTRAAWDSVLSYAQFLSCFKMGGMEFADAKDLEKEFIQYCAGENERLKQLGIFTDILRQEGHRQDVEQERTAKNG